MSLTKEQIKKFAPYIDKALRSMKLDKLLDTVRLMADLRPCAQQFPDMDAPVIGLLNHRLCQEVDVPCPGCEKEMPVELGVSSGSCPACNKAWEDKDLPLDNWPVRKVLEIILTPSFVALTAGEIELALPVLLKPVADLMGAEDFDMASMPSYSKFNRPGMGMQTLDTPAVVDARKRPLPARGRVQPGSVTNALRLGEGEGARFRGATDETFGDFVAVPLREGKGDTWVIEFAEVLAVDGDTLKLASALSKIPTDDTVISRVEFGL